MFSLVAISISASMSFSLFNQNWTRSKDNFSLNSYSLRESRTWKGVPSTLVHKNPPQICNLDMIGLVSNNNTKPKPDYPNSQPPCNYLETVPFAISGI